MKNLIKIVLGLAVLAVASGCSNPAQGVASTGTTGGNAQGKVAVTVSANILGNGARNLIGDSTVSTVLVVAVNSGTAEGSGTLTKGTSSWTGTINVSTTGSMTFTAYGENSTGGVVWTGSMTHNVLGNGDTLAIPLSQLTRETSTSQTGIVMEGVAGGTFYNGTANMTESTFHMSQNLITGAQYAAVTGLADPSSFSSVTNHPVDSVSWYGALVFCNKLSMADSLTPVYSISGSTAPSTWGTIPTTDSVAWDAATMNTSASGYRLPTEMQDMWAMMGGMSDGLTGDIVNGVNTLGYAKGYAGSTEASGGQTNIGQYAWSAVKVTQTATNPVGSLKANELGIYDLTGNVWEWDWDWSGSYPTTGQTDYTGPASGPYRLTRGGCWDSLGSDLMLTYRSYGLNPNGHTNNIGFRVVRP